MNDLFGNFGNPTRNAKFYPAKILIISCQNKNNVMVSWARCVKTKRKSVNKYEAHVVRYE